MATRSIKRNLMVWLLLPLLSLLAIAGSTAYYRGLRVSNEVYDRALYDSVLTLGILVRSQSGNISVDLPPVAKRMLEVDPMDKIYYTVKTRTGTTLIGDDDLPIQDILRGSAADAPVFFDAQHRGEPIRVAEAKIIPQGDAGPEVVVAVAETIKKRQAMAAEILQQSVAPLLIFLMLGLAAVWLVVTRAMKPLADISEEVDRRPALNFEPLQLAKVPWEIRPLTRAFNNLVKRFESSYTAQQRFVGNAAHQLRTPVAGMCALIEAELMGQVGEERHPLLVRLHKSALRMSRLVKQLLVLSRSEAGYLTQVREVDATTLVATVIDEHRMQAAARTIDLISDVEAGASIAGDPVMLGELIGNLVDNAIRYGPSDAQVTVRIRRQPHGVVLEVADQGTGIRPGEGDRLFERFSRGDGVSTEGSGLGLAIVKEIADAHRATLWHGLREGQGFVISLEFPVEANA